MTKKITLALMALFIAGLLPMAAFAADTASVSIPITCEAEDASDKNTAVIEPGSEEYRYTIREDSLTFTGSETKSFVLNFTEPGNYYYKVYQPSDASTSEHMDAKVHNIKVYVLWDENSSLAATPVIYMEGGQEKETGISFLNLPTAHYIENDRNEADSDNNNSSVQATVTNASVTGSVQTGDRTPVPEILVLMFVSAAVLAAVAKFKFCK